MSDFNASTSIMPYTLLVGRSVNAALSVSGLSRPIGATSNGELRSPEAIPTNKNFLLDSLCIVSVGAS